MYYLILFLQKLVNCCCFQYYILKIQFVGFDGPLLIENYSGDFGEEEELKAPFEWLSDTIEHNQ